MRDVYEWIDPFEERERADRSHAWGREEGRREIIAVISCAGQEAMDKALYDATRNIAQRVAAEIIRPRVMKYQATQRQIEDLQAAEYELAMKTASPIAATLTHEGKLHIEPSPRPKATPGELLMIYEIVHPVRINIALDPMMYALRRR